MPERHSRSARVAWYPSRARGPPDPGANRGTDHLPGHSRAPDTAEWVGGVNVLSDEAKVLSDEERTKREEDLTALLDLMRPSVQADGGDLALIEADVETGVIEVQLQGACSSCAISSATLQGGVERILKGRLDWVTEVRGGVDESADPFESAALGQGGYVPRW
jgi:Fe-S cluster biogenesis protein NfuA